MNGDSYTGARLSDFVADHDRVEGRCLAMIAVPADGRDDCGTIAVDEKGRVTGFSEKQALEGANYLNAGIYILPGGFCAIYLRGFRCLWNAVAPRWLAEHREIRAFFWPGRCVDIGTPERYLNAQELLRCAESADALPEGTSQC